jgi:hypothetical protein
MNIYACLITLAISTTHAKYFLGKNASLLAVPATKISEIKMFNLDRDNNLIVTAVLQEKGKVFRQFFEDECEVL